MAVIYRHTFREIDSFGRKTRRVKKMTLRVRSSHSAYRSVMSRLCQTVCMTRVTAFEPTALLAERVQNISI